jgi:hypothetical protein
MAVIGSVAKKPSLWCSADMDNILEEGDSLFKKFFKTDKSPTLMELKSVDRINFNGFQFGIEYCFDENGVEALCGQLRSTLCSDVPTRSLEAALYFLFINKGCIGALVVLSEYTVAVIKTDDTYMVFDSHSRDVYGWMNPLGASTLMNIGATHQSVVDFLLQLANSLNLQSTDQFEMIGILSCM